MPAGTRSFTTFAISLQGETATELGLVKESIKRAEKSGFLWIALLGGNYYSRFGFESGKHYGITVSENEFDNEHLQILFLDKSIKDRVSGRLVYCDAFYDADGNLL